MKYRYLLIVGLLSVMVGYGSALAGQMTLDKAFEKALAANPTIQAMVQRINQSRERIIQAKADYYPQLSLGASVTRNKYSDNDIAAGSVTASSQEYYEGAMSMEWILFSGFSTKYTVLAAKLDQDLEEMAKTDVIRNLLSSVAASFHAAQLALANQFIASADKSFYAKQLEDARIKQRAGKGSYSDVLNLNTRMNQAQIEMEKFKAQFDVARAGLAGLLGESIEVLDLPEPVFPKVETKKEMEPPEVTTMVAYALDTRPDLGQLRLALEIANADIKTAKAVFFPQLSLNGSVGADRTGSGSFESDDIENSVSLLLSYPLFSGGSDRAALQESRYVSAEARMDLKNLENTVVAEIRQDCFTVAGAQKQLRLYRENGSLVKQNRDMVEIEYQYGKTGLVTLNEVQNNLIQTQQKIALSLISLRQAWYELKSSSGSIYEAGN
ncbi:MAG: TolC family protein [Desulfobacteraceae bacterium]|nr:TolC family protein [Desulfobacteraceae bacterium]